MNNSEDEKCWKIVDYEWAEMVPGSLAGQRLELKANKYLPFWWSMEMQKRTKKRKNKQQTETEKHFQAIVLKIKKLSWWNFCYINL